MAARRVQWSGFESLDQLAPQWDQLAAREDGVYSSADWLQAWIGAFGGRRRPVLCTVWEGQDMVAAMPLLRSAGRRYSAPVNDHSPRFLPLARDEQDRQHLVEAALDARPASLQVQSLPADDPAVTVLHAAARRRGLRMLVESEHLSPVVDLRGGLQSYRQTRRHRLSEYERRRRKAVREHQARFVLVERPSDMERLLEAGLQLEAAGWKGRAGSAILCSPQTSRFYRELVRRFDRQGSLRLSALWLDGDLVAFDLALLVRGRYHLLKTTYDERRRALAPGMVLRLAVLERCFELGLDAHDFLGPDMPWKRVFADEARPHVSVRLFDGSPGGQSEFAYRRWVRPSLRAVYHDVTDWQRPRA